VVKVRNRPTAFHRKRKACAAWSRGREVQSAPVQSSGCPAAAYHLHGRPASSFLHRKCRVYTRHLATSASRWESVPSPDALEGRWRRTERHRREWRGSPRV